jgi:hypothetical protein
MLNYPTPVAIVFGLLLGVTGTHANAETVAQVLGHALGSLDCTELTDPDQKAACSAKALSSGNGCRSLSSSTMRNKCADERLVREVRHRSRPPVDVSWPPKERPAGTATTQSLSDDDYRHMGDKLLGRQPASWATQP